MKVSGKIVLRSAAVLLICASLGLFAYGLKVRARQPQSVDLVDTRAQLLKILRERAAEAQEPSAHAKSGVGLEGQGDLALAFLGGVGEPPAAWTPLQRVPIGQELAGKFYPALERELDRPTPRKNYCPMAYFANAPGWGMRVIWEEHPRKHWDIRYSQAGFRNPYEPSDTPPTLRVVLCGDSHIEGVVPYRETVAALLEKGLREADPEASVEVLNGASGGYDFYNYLGFLERSLHLRPDVFVVVVYGGNDFSGMVPIHAYFERVLVQLSSRELRERTQELLPAQAGAVAQGILQIAQFAEVPQNAEFALDGAVRAMRELDALARAHGVDLVCAYLPPQHDARPQDMAADLVRVKEALGFDEEDLGLTERLAERWLTQMSAAGIEVVDLRPALRGTEERAYWEDDHHINTHGSWLVAREILPRLLPHLERER